MFLMIFIRSDQLFKNPNFLFPSSLRRKIIFYKKMYKILF